LEDEPIADRPTDNSIHGAQSPEIEASPARSLSLAMAERSGSGPSSSAAWSTSGNRIDSPTEFRKSPGRASPSETAAGVSHRRHLRQGRRAQQPASLSQRCPCRADERYAAHRSQLSCPWHRTACERDRRSLNDQIDEFRIAQVQRSDGWIATTWNNMSDRGAFAAAGPRSRKAARRRPLPRRGSTSSAR
jgi:hypothetical protein